MKYRALIAWILLIIVLIGISGNAANAISPYSHVYYLFLDHPKGCEECYIPMIITREPLNQKSLLAGGIDNVAIITYERDSIWQIMEEPAKLMLPNDKSAAQARQLQWDGKQYRYQEVNKAEALKILKAPMGTIHISRPAIIPDMTEDKRKCILEMASGVHDPACDNKPKPDITPILIRDLSSTITAY